MFTISAFSTFFITVHDDTWTRTKKAVMTEYHQRITESIDLFDSTKMIVERHDSEKRKNNYILSLE